VKKTEQAANEFSKNKIRLTATKKTVLELLVSNLAPVYCCSFTFHTSCSKIAHWQVW